MLPWNLLSRCHDLRYVFPSSLKEKASNFDRFNSSVHIRRRILYYLFNIIFPCIWLSILSLLGFWLPPDSGEKITLGITVLLAFSVFMLLIAESMPATSEMVPLIEIYLTIVMALTSLSIVLTVYVLQLHHSGPVVIPIPHSFKYSLVRHIAPVIGMKKIVQIYAQEHNLIEKDDVYRCFASPKTKSIESPLIRQKKHYAHPHRHHHHHHHQYRFKSRSNEIHDDDSSTHDDEHPDDHHGSVKPSAAVSVGNGDIRSRRAETKKRSRSRRAQIVLIPQTAQQITPTEIIRHPRVQYEFLNSNLYLLEKHLKHLIGKQKHEEERNEIVNEWKLMALIMDRLLFWLFTALTILSTVLCLIIIPYLKNLGYIRALARDSIIEFSENQTIANVIEEQLRANSNQTSAR